MYKPKISVILPSIDPTKWENLYNQIKKSVGEFPFEVIACGPFFPTKELENAGNFRYVRDFGCPSRCLQLAASVAQGEYITWFPDDCIIFENTLAETIKFLDSHDYNSGITVLYSEGPNFSGNQHSDPAYWVSSTHQDLRLKHTNPEWKIAPIFIYNLELFKELGGLDCKFEHINMNTHDFAFRFQRQNGILYLSPSRVFASNWKPWGEPKGPIQLAYEENDAPLFKKLYDSEESPFSRDLDLWGDAPSIWPRRFNT